MAEARLDFTVELSQEISWEPLSTYNPEQVFDKALRAAVCFKWES